MTTKQMREIEEIERRVIDEVFNEGDLEVVDETHAPDYVGHWFMSGEEGSDIDDLKEYVRSLREAFPDLELDIEFLTTGEDTVTVGYTANATHEGEFMGIPPTGESGSVPGIMVHRYEDGKIVEGWGVYDTLYLAQQLGVVPEEFHLADFLETTLNLTKQDVLTRTRRAK